MNRLFNKIRLAYLEDMVNDSQVQEHLRDINKFRTPEEYLATEKFKGWIVEADAIAQADPEYSTLSLKIPSELGHFFKPYFFEKSLQPAIAVNTYKDFLKTYKFDFEDVIIDDSGNTYKGWWDPNPHMKEVYMDMCYEVGPDGSQRVVKDSEKDLINEILEATTEDFDWYDYQQ